MAKKNKNIKILYSLLLVILIFAAAFITYRHFHHKTIAVNNGFATPTSNVPTGNAEKTSGSQSKGPAGSSTQQATSSTAPQTPIGNFVSNHNVNLSGQPSSNIETSTCSTTPNVKCEITFSMDGITKSLPSMTTNSDGNANWINWSLQSIGLTRGSWKIKAIATNGNSSTSAEDANMLNISP